VHIHLTHRFLHLIVLSLMSRGSRHIQPKTSVKDSCCPGQEECCTRANPTGNCAFSEAHFGMFCTMIQNRSNILITNVLHPIMLRSVKSWCRRSLEMSWLRPLDGTSVIPDSSKVTLQKGSRRTLSGAFHNGFACPSRNPYDSEEALGIRKYPYE
jgi:hypothetical protein